MQPYQSYGGTSSHFEKVIYTRLSYHGLVKSLRNFFFFFFFFLVRLYVVFLKPFERMCSAISQSKTKYVSLFSAVKWTHITHL